MQFDYPDNKFEIWSFNNGPILGIFLRNVQCTFYALILHIFRIIYHYLSNKYNSTELGYFCFKIKIHNICKINITTVKF